MKALLIYSITTIFCSTLFAQSPTAEKSYELGFADVYVLKVKVVDKLLEKKSQCINGKGTNCSLYKIEIDSILYCPRNSVYDSSSLSKVHYMLASTIYRDRLENFKEYYLTTMPSTTAKYLALSNILQTKSYDKIMFYHNHGYLSGLIKCRKVIKDCFEKFIDTQ